jgi:hypothetical protein
LIGVIALGSPAPPRIFAAEGGLNPATAPAPLVAALVDLEDPDVSFTVALVILSGSLLQPVNESDPALV